MNGVDQQTDNPLDEAFWLRLLADISRERQVPNDWAGWGATTFADGTPIPNEPEPQFHLRSPTLARAVHLILWPPDPSRARSRASSVGAWLSTYGVEPEEQGAYPITDELSLNLEPNEQTLAVARELLSLWLDSEISVRTVERAIAGHPSVNAGDAA